MLLATIHGAFLSQQLWGSTYAIWPLLMLLDCGDAYADSGRRAPTRGHHHSDISYLRRTLRGQP